MTHSRDTPRRIITRIRRAGVGFALLCIAGATWAHDPGLSTVEGQFEGAELRLEFAFSMVDARKVWVAAHPGGTRAMPPADDRAWCEVARAWCSLSSNGTAVVPTEVRVGPINNNGIGFTLEYRQAAGRAVLSVPRLRDLPRNHREFVLIANGRGDTIAQKFLTADDDTVVFRGGIDVARPSGEQASRGPRVDAWPGRPALNDHRRNVPMFLRTFAEFLRLGVEHIWTGYDHLLFLFGLLVICRSFRSIATIISCFTIAHSLTLAAATLNLVHLPPQWTECAIAASIAFVGVENLMRRGAEPRGRALLTFAFGLIHGFGFATALRDLGVGHGGRSALLPLFSFNLGVEVGQIVVAAAALPCIRWLRRHELFVRVGVPVLSSFVAVAGMFWFVERAMG